MDKAARKDLICQTINSVGNEDEESDSHLEEVGINTMSAATYRRKKHLRRSAHEIDRSYVCPYEGCTKFFGSEGSQNLHIKIKHNGGTKTDREKLSEQIMDAYHR